MTITYGEERIAAEADTAVRDQRSIDSLFERDWIAGFVGAKTTCAGRAGKARRADSIAANSRVASRP
jgi:hypothetical protein